jgi:pimeloyl-ACP methyl ester carboxylesterase
VLLAVLLVVVGCGDGSPTATDEAATETGRDREEITVAVKGLELVGTLRLPDGEPPFPAVAIAHGSGPQSRHGTVQGQLGLTLPAPVAVYDELADGLQDRGYAVMTWDKRTCGPFNRCADNGYPTPPDDLTFATFVDDTAAILDALATRDDLDELIVIGHSKGGNVATELLDRRDDLAAVVLLAASAWPIDEVIAVQADRLAELVVAAGQQGAAADQAVADVRQLADDVAAIADGEVDGPAVGGASRAFWASWIAASERGAGARARGDGPDPGARRRARLERAPRAGPRLGPRTAGGQRPPDPAGAHPRVDAARDRRPGSHHPGRRRHGGGAGGDRHDRRLARRDPRQVTGRLR